jgi:transcriptional regulator with XRE-family HTH domain
MNWTQKDVALMTGVSEASVCQWERGRNKMGKGLWELLRIKAQVQGNRNKKP